MWRMIACWCSGVVPRMIAASGRSASAARSNAITLAELPAPADSSPPPPWPLTRATSRERALWGREWRRPQAIAWEEAGLEIEVALYVRCLAAAEQPNAATPVRTLVLQLMNDLGLSLRGLRERLWTIAAAGEASDHARRIDTGGPSTKARFRVVAGGC
jgi:hypothetical protein